MPNPVIETGKPLTVTPTGIPGLLVVDLAVHGDNRGWFKENWQRAKMLDLGLPDFGPVQNNISFNDAIGTTRGLHAEPWDKYVSVATGRVFGAWVDLREGASFGATFTTEIDASSAVFVPRGVANGYQTLEADTAYTYLVNDHWSRDAAYAFVNLADETAAIDWPIALHDAETSAKDRAHPRLADVTPVRPLKTLVIGGGQLGTALRAALPEADVVTRSTLDLTNPDDFDVIAWRTYDTVINAAAYTSVDAAETPEGRRAAWAVNVDATARLARIATENRLTLVHVSSDYVFDGTAELHTETASFSPLGVYGQTKAAADAIVGTVPRHYIVRTSWVVGEGQNFVRTMESLARRGISPRVVNDQFGRLTFADDLAAGIRHLIETKASFGTYNLSNSGPVMSWADIAREVYGITGFDRRAVTGISAADYGEAKNLAPRPTHSALDLSRIEATGFEPRDVRDALRDYLQRSGAPAASGRSSE
jgi:dTDP-4-dehydrorhamnose reductase/dTDP-4-dehydrorhamnose 3,5-epimerase